MISVVMCGLIRYNLLDQSFGFGFISLGICAAWLQLIFVMGQPSRTFLGDFIVMFYNTIKVKVWYYIQIVILFLVGFVFAFWILHHSTGQQDIQPGTGFSDFWESLMKTGAMAVGELNFNDYYGLFTDSKTIRIFAMITMAILIISGTVVLTNLLIASIIQDYSRMKADVDYQNLQFMGRNVIHKEYLVTNCSRWMANYVLVEHKAKYCTHILCSKKNCILQEFPYIRESHHELGTTRSEAKQKLLQKLKKNQQKCGCQEVVREGSITDTETQHTNDAVIHVQDNPENV